MINKNSIIKMGTKFSLTELDKDYFLLPISTEGVAEEKLFSLNELGRFIVQNIDGHTTVGEIIQKVHFTYQEEFEIIESDTLLFINRLLDRGIVIMDN